SGTGIHVTLLGLELTGNFDVEKQTMSDNSQTVRLAVSNLALQIASGGTTFVNVSNGTGSMIVDRLGIAAQFSVGATFNIPGATLSGGTIRMAINTRPVPVDQPFTVTGSPAQRLQLQAGPFVRVTVTGANLTI